MKDLKLEATRLGLDFKGNISKVELTQLIENHKSQIASDSSENNTVVMPDNVSNTNKLSGETQMEEVVNTEHVSPEKTKKIKVIINPRDKSEGETEGYVRLNGYSAQFQFDEEIEMPEAIVEFLKSKGGNVYVGNGKSKWQSRYIIEKL